MKYAFLISVILLFVLMYLSKPVNIISSKKYFKWVYYFWLVLLVISALISISLSIIVGFGEDSSLDEYLSRIKN